MRTIVWFRGKDLRLTDHEPLLHALSQGEVIPLFVLDPFFFSPRAAAELPHRMQFLLESLAALRRNLQAKGTQLLLARGPSVELVPALANLWQADAVVAQRWVEPFARVRDERVARRLGGRFRLFEGETLAHPDSVATQDSRPFSVYTPFARAFRKAIDIAAPSTAPKQLPACPRLAEVPEQFRAPEDELPSLNDLGITQNPYLQPGGERAGLERVQQFVSTQLEGYGTRRDRMDLDGTSRLSADLKFGTVSVRKLWHVLSQNRRAENAEDVDKFQSELLWREFAHHCLWHRPELLRRPFRRDFERFVWREPSGPEWQAWCEGMTGYPIVDAAARQLLREGYVHNRARMIAASFLTKHLVIHYRGGEAHYLKYLTDGDWAQNNAGWQWSAGCGCDAQPYFRVFNPVTQGEKFDPEGSYVKRYVPELTHLESKYVHKPWLAPASVLHKAGVMLGETYPRPIVDHDLARQRFLCLAESTVKRGG